MGRRKAKKPRGSTAGAGGDRFHIDDRPVDMAEMLAYAAQLADTVDDPGLLLYMDDPALGLGKPATGIDPESGTLVTAETEEPFPVALFEPERAVMTQLPGQPPTEGQVEGAIAAGMARLPRGFAQLKTCRGWGLHRLEDDRFELRTPDGGAYSRISPESNPAWVSAALHHRYVVCLYGPQLGVRLPPDRTAEQYTAADRLAEFRTARERGLVAGGIIAFHNNR